MKNLNIILTLCALIISHVNRATPHDQYLEAMQKCIATLYQSADIAQLQETVNTLERIGSAEGTKWEPQYYRAFGYIMMATREKEILKKDVYLNHALEAIEKAKQVHTGDSEIIALEGFVYMLRISVDPATRGPEFASLATQTFNKAISLNENNPRAFALLAQMQFGTARFFGSSAAEACATLVNALEKFKRDQPKSPLAPTWGKAMAESLLPSCK